MKTPLYILNKFEQAAKGLDYGEVTLRLSIKMGRPRYIISCEESYIPNEGSSTCDDFSAEDCKSLQDQQG